MTRPLDRRAELLEQLALAGRASSAATVMFHTAVAARQGLSASAREGARPAGALRAADRRRAGPAVGLAPASVTALINRLEGKGFARRVPNPGDGRSVLVEVDSERVYATVAPVRRLGGVLYELYAGYTDEQLEVILHFLTEAARRQQEATARLTADQGP